MNLGANVAFDCSNGGTVTMVGKATSLTRVGVERHTGSYTATVSIDNSTKQVDIVDGVGELQITTDKNVGAVVNVRAIELNGSKAVHLMKSESM